MPGNALINRRAYDIPKDFSDARGATASRLFCQQLLANRLHSINVNGIVTVVIPDFIFWKKTVTYSVLNFCVKF